MQPSGFFSGFPLWTRFFLLVLAMLILIPSILIVAPSIVTAIRQGRSITMGPIAIGQFEEPAVKSCKLVLEDTKDALRSLQQQVSTLSDLMKSQSSDVQKLISERNNFVQLTQEAQQNQYYKSNYIRDTINTGIEDLVKSRDFTRDGLVKTINDAITYINRIRDYCLNMTGQSQ